MAAADCIFYTVDLNSTERNEGYGCCLHVHVHIQYVHVLIMSFSMVCFSLLQAPSYKRPGAQHDVALGQSPDARAGVL